MARSRTQLKSTIVRTKLNIDPKILFFLIREGVTPIFLFVKKVANEATPRVFEP